MGGFNLNNQIRNYFPEKQSIDQSKLNIRQSTLTKEVAASLIDERVKLLDVSSMTKPMENKLILDQESIIQLQDVSTSKVQLSIDNVEKNKEDRVIFEKCFLCGCDKCLAANLQVTISDSDIVITYKTTRLSFYDDLSKLASVEKQKKLDDLAQFVSNKIQDAESRVSISNDVERDRYSRKVYVSQIIISSNKISSDKEKQILDFIHNSGFKSDFAKAISKDLSDDIMSGGLRSDKYLNYSKKFYDNFSLVDYDENKGLMRHSMKIFKIIESLDNTDENKDLITYVESKLGEEKIEPTNSSGGWLFLEGYLKRKVGQFNQFALDQFIDKSVNKASFNMIV